jgi:hypothetical protein
LCWLREFDVKQIVTRTFPPLSQALVIRRDKRWMYPHSTSAQGQLNRRERTFLLQRVMTMTLAQDAHVLHFPYRQKTDAL